MGHSRRDFVAGVAGTVAGTPLMRRALTGYAGPSSNLPILTDQQLGHIRHIERLAFQPDGEWAMMGSIDPAQEDLTAYRYQLAIMAYALGLAHYHRLPAAPGLFRSTFDRLIHKMLRREVWSYWRETSRSGPRLDPDLKTLREGWTDPVRRENIMYSGHLHAMVGMYATLFNDDKYDAPGSLTFRYDPIFYGMGPETYPYDHASLTRVIRDQMVESGWLGVPCEPNNVFIVCNQYPILGFRFFDLRKGTTYAPEATAGYQAAWDRKGMLDGHGHVITTWMVRQDLKRDAFSGGFDAWAGSAMNAWNRDVVRERYPKQIAEWVEPGANGTVSLKSPAEVMAIRAARASGGAMPPRDRTFPWRSPDFGYIAMWASEMGDAATVRGLLAHADRHMNPTWERGAFYYPRNDQPYGPNGDLTFMDPVTGNAMLAYARLNVPDGLWSLYNRPRTAAQFKEPAIDAASATLDVVGARFDPAAGQLAMAVRGRGRRAAEGRLTVANVPEGAAWTLRQDGAVVATSRSVRGGRATRTAAGLEIAVRPSTTSRLDLHLT